MEKLQMMVFLSKSYKQYYEIAKNIIEKELTMARLKILAYGDKDSSNKLNELLRLKKELEG